MGLYRGVGGVRDDLNIHEKALDILIELLKKEQVRRGAWPGEGRGQERAIIIL